MTTYVQYRSPRHNHENSNPFLRWETSRSRSSLLEVPGDVDAADFLGISKLSEHDRRDVDVASGATGAAVSDRGQDRVAVGAVDTDLLATDRALVGVCVDAVVSFRQGGDVLQFNLS